MKNDCEKHFFLQSLVIIPINNEQFIHVGKYIGEYNIMEKETVITVKTGYIAERTKYQIVFSFGGVCFIFCSLNKAF